MNQSRSKSGKRANASPAREKGRGRFARGKSGPQPSDILHLYGLHSVRAALANPKRQKSTLFVTSNARSRIDAALLSGIDIEEVDAGRLDALTGPNAVHQGVVLACQPLDALDASELFHLADASLVLALDQITDPHNVGAILRSAVAFGVDAVLITHRQSATETATLAKSASGALDMIPIIDVRNLSKAIDELNAMGFVSVGLDSEGSDVLETALNSGGKQPTLLVLGSEGRGLREKTRLSCTTLARLDMPGSIKSLNVSNAAALALYVAKGSGN